MLDDIFDTCVLSFLFLGLSPLEISRSRLPSYPAIGALLNTSSVQFLAQMSISESSANLPCMALAVSSLQAKI